MQDLYTLPKPNLQKAANNSNVPTVVKELLMGENQLSNGSGSGEPFQGYAVQRMPVGLAKELVSSSTGSGNSGGLGALVGRPTGILCTA